MNVLFIGAETGTSRHRKAALERCGHSVDVINPLCIFGVERPIQVLVWRAGEWDVFMGSFRQSDPSVAITWDLNAAVTGGVGIDLANGVTVKNVEALANRGDVFRSLGRAQEALANYTRCLALRPDHTAIISKCGLVLAERTSRLSSRALPRWAGQAWTAAWLIAPLPLLFHRPFLNGVFWPIIGAASP